MLDRGPAYWYYQKRLPRPSILMFFPRGKPDPGILIKGTNYALFKTNKTNKKTGHTFAHQLRALQKQVNRVVRQSATTAMLRSCAKHETTARRAINANPARQHAQHIQFDTDSTDFLLDSGSSNHIWMKRKHFQDYKALTEDEQKDEGILGINGITAPIGIGNVPIRLEHDQGNVHNILLQDVRHLPQSPLNIIIPQCFSQQRQSEGDPNAHCDIRNDGFLLEWTRKNRQKASKFVPLTAGNVGISRRAPGDTRFQIFAALFRRYAFPAYVSDEENTDNDEPEDPPSDLPLPEPPPNVPTETSHRNRRGPAAARIGRPPDVRRQNVQAACTEKRINDRGACVGGIPPNKQPAPEMERTKPS